MTTVNNIRLYFRPRAVHGVYGINYYFRKNGGEQQRLQCEITVVYCGQYMDDYAIYQVSKNDFVVNRNESDEYLYDMAKKCGEALYPLTILVDKSGRLTHVRTDNVSRNWPEKRAELGRYYQGEVAERYFNRVEEWLNHKGQVRQIITNDLFLNRLLGINYQGVREKGEFQNEIPLVPFKAPLLFDSFQYIDMDSVKDEESILFDIIQSGETGQPYKVGMLYGKQEVTLYRPDAEVSARYRLCYGLDKNTYHITSVEGFFELSVDGNNFSSVRVEAYRLAEKTVEYGRDESMVKMERKKRKEDHSFTKLIKDIFK